MLSRDLPEMHLSRAPCDDRIATSAVDILLNALDYDHTYFLASDVANFKQAATNLDNQLSSGDVSFAFNVYDIFKQRVASRVDYVQELLKKGFDVNEKESYIWKRKDALWAADEAEWNELWRKKIKNEYMGKIVAQKLKEQEAAKADKAEKKKEEAKTGDEDDDKLAPEDSISKSYKQFLTVLNDNDAMWILERYLTSFTQAYDPHSDYLSANNTEDFEISMKLSLVGIGALLSSEDGAAKVERLIPGGPAERDGRLKTGDKIIAVAQGDDKPVDVMHWPLSKTVRLIRGKKNTRVVLTINPASDVSGSTISKIDLIRDEVKLEDQAAKSKIMDVPDGQNGTRHFGVITLPEFYADLKSSGKAEARSASKDVAALVADLKKKNVDGIILDLRNNGGGSLNEAIDMTGLFIDSGPVVQVKDQRSLHILSDPDPDILYAGPMLVLVNRLSASASEILAAALQDYGRAIIVGDAKTHGKGTVQSLVNLNNFNPSLGSLKITTASFYRIAGGSTQMNGVHSDIVIPSALSSMELGEEYLPHALAWSSVYPALYQPLDNLRKVVPTLKDLSEKRRGQDEKFKTYNELVEKLDERQKSNVISLNLDERLQLAKSEKELQSLLDEAEDGVEKKDDKDDKDADVVLKESLHILCDFVDLAEKEKAASSIAGKNGKQS